MSDTNAIAIKLKDGSFHIVHSYYLDSSKDFAKKLFKTGVVAGIEIVSKRDKVSYAAGEKLKW